MQMGIGAIPDAVLKYLYNKKDLGVHSELFSDGVIDLVDAGVMTNAQDATHREDCGRIYYRFTAALQLGG